MDDAKLVTAFKATQQRWHEAHGTPYVWTKPTPPSPPPTHQTTTSHYSGCGSCGWGEEAFHEALEHGESEAQQISEAYGEAREGKSTEAEGMADEGMADEGMPESAAWATDATPPEGSFAPADGPGGGEIMVDPWAPPASASDSDSGGSWGWGGDGGDGDGGGDGGGCGGGCGGD